MKVERLVNGKAQCCKVPLRASLRCALVDLATGAIFFLNWGGKRGLGTQHQHKTDACPKSETDACAGGIAARCSWCAFGTACDAHA